VSLPGLAFPRVPVLDLWFSHSIFSALKKVVQRYPDHLYGYADDHKLALSFCAGNPHNVSEMLTQLDRCVNDVIKCMTTYKLKMNE